MYVEMLHLVHSAASSQLCYLRPVYSLYAMAVVR
jgi:hypothetical protein